MKKNGLLVLIFGLSFIIPFNVFALTRGEISSRNVCSKYEVAIAKEDRAGDPSSTRLEKVSCYDDYNSALSAMNSNSNMDTILLERKDGNTKIVNAKAALVNLTLRGGSVTYYYPTASSWDYDNYMVTNSSTGAVDGAFLDFDINSRRAKVKVAGYTGWVNEDAYDIVPIVWVYSIGYYRSTNDEFKHFFARDITTITNSSYGIALSKKPDYLNNSKNYFSYDGHYFYTNQYKMITDYKNGNYNNAVNKNNPYYNYYQYLPNHSKTNYSSSNINKYIRDGLGFYYTTFGNTLDIKGNFDTGNVSKLYGMGTYFIYAQEQYGANAILSFGLNRNESGDGRSKISTLKNNGFGQGAVDSSPFGSAYGFLTYQGGIYNHAQHFVNDMYENANHSYYNGGQFGNKQGGWNIVYASDPFWGEKAASYYYRFDRYFGFQDYNFYQLAINTTSVQAKASASNSARTIYTLKNKEIPIIILEEVKGDNVGGSNIWYKIVSDLNIDSNKNSYSKYPEKFDWDNSYVYVPSSYFKKINTARDGIKSFNDVYPYVENTYKYAFYNDGEKLTPKVGKSLRDTSYYYDGGLIEKKNSTLLKDKYVMVYDRAVDKNGNVVSYQVTSDYKYDQKEWVSAKDISIVGGAYGKQTVIPTGYSSNVFSESRESSHIISGIYDGCFVPILEELVGSDGKTYYKVPISLTSNSNSYGYTLKSDSDAYITSYNSEAIVKNNYPVIEVSDKQIKEGESIDLKKIVKVADEDSDILTKLQINGNVNTNIPGSYKVTYSVTDNGGLKSEKTITVTVIKDELPVIVAKDKEIFVGEDINLLDGVSASDKEDGNLINKVKIITNELNNKKTGSYKVVYSVSDSVNHNVTKTIIVTVKEKVSSPKTEDTEITKSKDNNDKVLTQKSGEFYLNELSFDNNKKKYLISGYLIIKESNNKYSDNISYELVLRNIDTNKEKTISIDRWTSNVPFDLGTENGYDYSGSWFKGYIDFSANDLAGDYEVYMKASNSDSFALEKVVNSFNIDFTRRAEDAKYGYNFKVNLSSKSREFTLNIRKGNLITTGVSNTYRNMSNNYDDMKFIDNKLNVIGTSYNYGISYDKDNFVERKLILENTSSFNRYTYDLGSTNTGGYVVNIKDGKDKTLAWYNNTIDVSNLDKGVYSMIVYTKTKDVSDYGEITDVFASINEAKADINGKKYYIRLNKNRGNRIELVIE